MPNISISFLLRKEKGQELLKVSENAKAADLFQS